MTGQTKIGSKAPNDRSNINNVYVTRIGVTGGPTLEPGPGLGLAGERLVAGSLPTGPGRAQPKRAMWARPPVSSPLAVGFRRGRCNGIWVAVMGGDPGNPIPRQWL